MWGFFVCLFALNMTSYIRLAKWDGVIGMWFVTRIVVDMSQLKPVLLCVLGDLYDMFHFKSLYPQRQLLIDRKWLLLVLCNTYLFTVSKVTGISDFAGVPGNLKSCNVHKFINIFPPLVLQCTYSSLHIMLWKLDWHIKGKEVNAEDGLVLEQNEFCVLRALQFCSSVASFTGVQIHSEWALTYTHSPLTKIIQHSNRFRVFFFISFLKFFNELLK